MFHVESPTKQSFSDTISYNIDLLAFVQKNIALNTIILIFYRCVTLKMDYKLKTERKI